VPHPHTVFKRCCEPVLPVSGKDSTTSPNSCQHNPPSRA